MDRGVVVIPDRKTPNTHWPARHFQEKLLLIGIIPKDHNTRLQSIWPKEPSSLICSASDYLMSIRIQCTKPKKSFALKNESQSLMSDIRNWRSLFVKYYFHQQRNFWNFQKFVLRFFKNMKKSISSHWILFSPSQISVWFLTLWLRHRQVRALRVPMVTLTAVGSPWLPLGSCEATLPSFVLSNHRLLRSLRPHFVGFITAVAIIVIIIASAIHYGHEITKEK